MPGKKSIIGVLLLLAQGAEAATGHNARGSKHAALRKRDASTLMSGGNNNEGEVSIYNLGVSQAYVC
jgi:hypothetical protein